MKGMIDTDKYWVIYDHTDTNSDDGVGWTNNIFIANTYFKHRKELSNSDICVKELERKEDIKPFILGQFPKIYDDFTEDYGENGIDLFKYLELKIFSHDGKYTIATDAFIDKCESCIYETGWLDNFKYGIERHIRFIRNHSLCIGDKHVRSVFLDLAHVLSSYCLVFDLRSEYFDYCYYGFTDRTEEYEDFKRTRDACLSITGIDIVTDKDADYAFVGIFDSISVYEVMGMLCWIGDDKDEK